MIKNFLGMVSALLVFATSAMAASNLTFTWDDPNNDPATLTGYRLERSNDQQATWGTVSTVPVSPRTATDTVSVAGEVCWRVRAIAGTAPDERVSEPSNVVCVTFPHPPVNVTVTITLAGTAQ